MVLQWSPLRVAVYLAASVLFLLVGVWMVADGAVKGWFVVAIGALCTFVLGAALVRPNRLVLDADGLTTVRSLGRRWHARWRECGPFEATVSSMQYVTRPLVVFDCEKPMPRKQDLTGHHHPDRNATLPQTYGLPAAELADLLNRYRAAAPGDVSET